MTVVKDAVRAWKQRQAEVFMPLAHRPGEAQADFGEATVRLRGEQVKVALFVMSLPYRTPSSARCFRANAPRRSRRATAGPSSSSAACRSGSATTTARSPWPRLPADAAGVTREFLRLESHYLFEHHFCLVRRPNEKGHVENLVGYARRNFLVPVPEIDDLEGSTSELAQCCRQDLSRTLRGKPATKEELLEEEQTWFLPLAAQAFEARRVEPARPIRCRWCASTATTTRCRRQYAHHDVTAIGGIEEVRLVVEDRVVADIRGIGARRTSSSIRCITWPCWNASRARWTSPTPGGLESARGFWRAAAAPGG